MVIDVIRGASLRGFAKETMIRLFKIVTDVGTGLIGGEIIRLFNRIPTDMR